MAKMFCMWRATVCSLITKRVAISRLLFPAATRRKTSSSRSLSPYGSPLKPSGAARPPAPRRPCSQAREHVASGFELQHGGVLVTQRAAGQARPRHACAPPHRVPRAPAKSTAPPAERPARRAGRHLRMPAAHGHARKRPAARRSVGSRDLLQLVARAARVGQIPHREHDLHAGRQKSRARDSGCADSPKTRRIAPTAAHAFPSARRRSAKPGLRLVPAPARGPVRLFGGGELSPQSVDLALPVEAPCRRQAR